jgi:hypothetical protein
VKFYIPQKRTYQQIGVRKTLRTFVLASFLKEKKKEACLILRAIEYG